MKDKPTKWIVWYKHNTFMMNTAQEYQEMLEFTNWFEAVYYYIKLYQAFGRPKKWKKAIEFDMKLYRIKN